MGFLTRFVNWLIRSLLHILLKMDVDQLKKVPPKGPLILAVNHVNFLDAPVIAVHLLPKPITALVKEETWNSPLLGALFDLWGGSPSGAMKQT